MANTIEIWRVKVVGNGWSRTTMFECFLEAFRYARTQSAIGLKVEIL